MARGNGASSDLAVFRWGRRGSGPSSLRSRRAIPKSAVGGWLWPVSSHKLNSRWGDGRGHKGIDIAASTGEPVHAAKAGAVKSAGSAGAYGLLVVLDHNGTETAYAHLSALLVRPNQTVEQGEVIGRAGCTGRCSGTHLHFEIRPGGVAVNPLPYFAG